MHLVTQSAASGGWHHPVDSRYEISIFSALTLPKAPIPRFFPRIYCPIWTGGSIFTVSIQITTRLIGDILQGLQRSGCRLGCVRDASLLPLLFYVWYNHRYEMQLQVVALDLTRKLSETPVSNLLVRDPLACFPFTPSSSNRRNTQDTRSSFGVHDRSVRVKTESKVKSSFIYKAVYYAFEATAIWPGIDCDESCRVCRQP